MKETIENEIIVEKFIREEVPGGIDIGSAAGMIWRSLDKKSDAVNLSTLKSELPISSNLLMMGLGWLAREDKLTIEMSENSPSYRISLKY